MSCSCHIAPPCSHCSELYQCDGCGDLKHPTEDGLIVTTEEKALCENCAEASELELPRWQNDETEKERAEPS
jgi:hypothetical protein